MNLVNGLSWGWIALMASAPFLLGLLVAYPVWRMKQIILGNLAGTAVIFGAALALLMEAKDHSFYTEQDLRSAFTFPLMLGLPVMWSDVEIKQRSRKKVFEWVFAVVLCLLVCVTEIYVLRRG